MRSARSKPSQSAQPLTSGGTSVRPDRCKRNNQQEVRHVFRQLELGKLHRGVGGDGLDHMVFAMPGASFACIAIDNGYFHDFPLMYAIGLVEMDDMTVKQ